MAWGLGGKGGIYWLGRNGVLFLFLSFFFFFFPILDSGENFLPAGLSVHPGNFIFLFGLLPGEYFKVAYSNFFIF